MEMNIFWDNMPCGPVVRSRRFGETCCPHMIFYTAVHSLSDSSCSCKSERFVTADCHLVWFFITASLLLEQQVHIWHGPGATEDFRDFGKSVIEPFEEQSPTRGSQTTSSPQVASQWFVFFIACISTPSVSRKAILNLSTTADHCMGGRCRREPISYRNIHLSRREHIFSPFFPPASRENIVVKFTINHFILSTNLKYFLNID
jgi:hypothetical protein